jgi:hypothetical protein
MAHFLWGRQAKKLTPIRFEIFNTETRSDTEFHFRYCTKDLRTLCDSVVLCELCVKYFYRQRFSMS